MNQDEFYERVEADKFFFRNSPESDLRFPRPSKSFIHSFIGSVRSFGVGDQVMEVGCFVGDLLAEYAANGAEIHGVEPSSAACDFAHRQFGLTLENRSFSNSKFFNLSKETEGSFDLVILDDVLGWIDRSRILQTMAVVDWLVPVGGFVFIRELYSDQAFAVRNHHHPNADIRNFRFGHGHHQMLIGTGKYAIKRIEIRDDEESSNSQITGFHSSWADVLLMKVPEVLIPTIKIEE